MPALTASPGGMYWLCGGGGNCESGFPGLPSLAILSADTQPFCWNSDSIFFRRISSATSEIRIQRKPIGVGRSPALSYTINSISFALSMSSLKVSSVHWSVRVARVLAPILSSTFKITNVSGPRENLPAAAWSTSLTAWILISRWPVRGFRMFGMFKLSSVAIVSLLVRFISHGCGD